MTPAAALDIIIRDYDGSDSGDSDNATRRLMLLAFLQHVHDYIHMHAEWPWTYKEWTGMDAVAITAGHYTGDFPTDFMEFGQHGGLWENSTRARWKEVSKHFLMRMKYEQTVTGQAQTLIFAISGGKIQIPMATATALSFNIYGRLLPPTLVDDDGEDPDELILPNRYIHTTLLPAVRFLTQESKSDAISGEYGSQFKDGLSQMMKIENPQKTGNPRWPTAMRGGW